MKTLMATDGSHEATNALRAAARLLRKRDNKVHVLCVAPAFYEPGSRKKEGRLRAEYQRRIARETKTILFDQGGETREQKSSEIQLEEDLQNEANEIIEDATDQLTRHGLDVTTVIAEGNPATEVLGQAEQGEYDLIVLGASGATDMKHRMLGSVSAKVTGQAPCSVAVVK
jgi:nucleotide-binding universal stress UspA family protein